MPHLGRLNPDSLVKSLVLIVDSPDYQARAMGQVRALHYAHHWARSGRGFSLARRGPVKLEKHRVSSCGISPYLSYNIAFRIVPTECMIYTCHVQTCASIMYKYKSMYIYIYIYVYVCALYLDRIIDACYHMS